MTSPLVQFGYRFSAPNGGAGHAQDWIFPPPEYVQGAGNANCRSRAGVILAGVGFSGGTTGGTANACWQGTDSFQYFVGTDATSFAGQHFAGVLPLHLRAGGDGKDYVDPTISDQLVYRYICRMTKGPGNNPLNTGTHDFGFQIHRNSGLSGGCFKNNLDGWFFQLKDDATVTVGVRGQNGVVAQDVNVGDTATTWHSYEWRFTNGTKQQFARVQAFIDGQPVALPALTAAYGPGTNNPLVQMVGGITAFRPYINCDSGVANSSILVAQLRMICATDLASAL